MKSDPSFIHDWTVWMATGITGFVVWVGRIVFTNNKRIDALEKDHKHARELRELQDKTINEIHSDQKRLLSHILKGGGRE